MTVKCIIDVILHKTQSAYKIAKDLNRPSNYVRQMIKQGNPRLDNFIELIDYCGYEICIRDKEDRSRIMILDGKDD